MLLQWCVPDSDRTANENNDLTTRITEIRQFLNEHTDSGPQKEEKIKSLHALKKQLDVDMLNLFVQVSLSGKHHRLRSLFCSLFLIPIM